MWVTNSITNQFEKACINDRVGGERNAIAGALIRQHQCSTIGILIRTVMDVSRVDADVMPGHTWDQSSLRRHRPTFDMGFEEIRIVSNEFGCALVAPVDEEFGCTYQCCNV